MGTEPRLDDPLFLIAHVLGVLRTEADRDSAIEQLIQDLEDQRAQLVALRLTRRN